jgi:hypothetical protein
VFSLSNTYPMTSKISKAFFRAQIGARLSLPFGSGFPGSDSTLAAETHLALPAARFAWSARILFSGEQTVLIDFPAGTITPTAAGVRQVESFTILASAGATAAGNLQLTVTGSGIAGSPRTVLVPLTPARHSHPYLIAAACAAALSAVPSIADLYEVTAALATVTLRRKYAYANDATLNVAIAAGLGVGAVTNSANTTAGVAGVVIERPGGDGKDAFGTPLDAASFQRPLGLYIASLPIVEASDLQFVHGTARYFPLMSPGGAFVASGEALGSLPAVPLEIQAERDSACDIVFLAE